MTEAIITAVVGLVTTGIAYIVGWRRNKADAKKVEVENDMEILKTYKNELEYFSKQLEACRNEIKELRSELSALRNTTCTRPDCPKRLNP